MSEETQTRNWVHVQKKTFTGWANNYLKERILKINDLASDLEDGVLLINLLEIISSKKILKFNKQPKIRMQKIENNNYALNFIKQEGLKLVGIGAEDIVDSQLKLILGLIWTLILRYQIQMAEDENSPKAALLDWVRKQVAPYGLKVDNFTNNWQDGRVLSALTDSLKPGVLDMNTLTGDAVNDVERAMDLAEEHYEIPKIMDPSDMVNLPDELSVITYVSYFRDYALNKAKRDLDAAEALERRRRNFSDKSQVVVEGSGLQGGYVNKKAPFVIKAMNYYGEAIPRGGENFTATVIGSDNESLTVNLVDNNNGTYDGSYVARIPQTYTLRVLLESEDVQNSPWSPKIDGASTKSNAFGPGLEKGLVGVPSKFKIQSRNEEENTTTEGGDEFAVKVTSPQGPVPATLKDNGDGSYDVTFTPTKGGDYQVEVTIRGEPLEQGAFAPQVLNSDANNSYCEGEGFEKAQAKRTTQFTIHSVHADGSHATSGQDPFEVSLHGPHEVSVAITDNDDGTYSVTYTPEKPGDYEIFVTLDGQNIKDIPKAIHIKPASDPNLSYAEGPGLESGQEDKPSEFKIHAVDPDGEHRKDGGDGFVTEVISPSGVIESTLVDNGDGTYDVEFSPKEDGEYTINLTLDGDNVNGFPKKVYIKPAAIANNSYAQGKGLTQLFDNEVAEFTIYAIDRHNNQRKDGGDAFDVKVQGPQGDVPAKLVDNNDGTYSVSYEPEVVGDYNILVTLAGTPIKDMPVNVTCIEGADGDQSSFGSFTFTVTAKNKKGEDKTTGGDLFLVAVTGPAEFITLEAKDNTDGSYTAAYTLAGNGRFNIEVKLNNKSIQGSPFKQVLGNPGKKNPDVKSFTTESKCNYQN